ncbi:hypothetical protein ACHAXS_000186 [Conticribra weissflogii]
MLKNFVRFGLEHYGSDQQGVNNTRRFLSEWLSILHCYVPVEMLEVLSQKMNHRPSKPAPTVAVIDRFTDCAVYDVSGRQYTMLMFGKWKCSVVWSQGGLVA